MMLTRTLFDSEQPAPTIPFSLRLMRPEPPDVRINDPHVTPIDGLADLYQSVRDENEDSLPELSDEEKRRAREEMSLAAIYQQWLLPWRTDRRKQGKLKGGTLQKEKQSVRCFHGWDASPERAPSRWPRGITWNGLPIGYLAPKYLEKWVMSRLVEGYSPDTMRGRWNHVRTILNLIRRLGIIDNIPILEFCAVVDTYQTQTGEGDDELPPTIYTPSESIKVYQRLHEADMRAAWVLGLNGGPRTVDLFSLRWTANVRLGERPELYYRAVKTGKRHWVPLHPIAVQHLQRLIALQGHLDPAQPQGLVFPRLTSAAAADPERSRPARRRNERIKSVMRGVGIPIEGDYEKPWQCLRSTCNSTLNNHRPGAGFLVTHGKEADVSSQNYWNHHPTLVEAIATMPMPKEFSLV